jgi:hypothetical protein
MVFPKPEGAETGVTFRVARQDSSSMRSERSPNKGSTTNKTNKSTQTPGFPRLSAPQVRLQPLDATPRLVSHAHPTRRNKSRTRHQIIVVQRSQDQTQTNGIIWMQKS